MNRFVTSCALVGVDPRPVRVETTVGGGRGQFIIVGLPDAAVRESRERVRSAVKASGFRFPSGRVVVSLSPADLPKTGALYDLPIALSVVQATEDLGERAGDFVSLGELSLHGDVKPTRGAVVAACVAEQTSSVALVPPGSCVPASVVALTGTVTDLRHAVDVVRGRSKAEMCAPAVDGKRVGIDLKEVRGQPVARRSLEVAAAGGHHMLMVGPPGAGKSLLASCLPTLLPKLTEEEEREVALIAAAIGVDHEGSSGPPFRAPHHSISMAALVGGGAGIPKPGEVTRAHRGVLFLDELGEFPPAVLDSLRQPMEAGHVLVSRQAASIRFPTAIQVIAASNPCPCGYRGERNSDCECIGARLDRYRARLSGPLLDRFDLRLRVERLRPIEMQASPGEPSAEVRKRVVAAREVQGRRDHLNRSLSASDLLPLEDPSVRSLLLSEPEAIRLTARGWDRVRRVARTIADLEGSEMTSDVHIKEAMTLRGDIT
ncbi:MAG: YifB family Mg chelatase-like AAA ATPase [Acidimicrobiia bacterium]|nr:YifB family Mg chelatase-like AAA ATPase [Acidimicrobiia bacterium]